MNDECTHKVMTGKCAVGGIEERLEYGICNMEYRACGCCTPLQKRVESPVRQSAQMEPVGSAEVVIVKCNRQVGLSGTGL
jgi:hypothetical protein